jgi:hypothetical protein
MSPLSPRLIAGALILLCAYACGSTSTEPKIPGGAGQCSGQSRTALAVNPPNAPLGTLPTAEATMIESTVGQPIQVGWFVQRSAVPGSAAKGVLRDARDTTRRILELDSLPAANTMFAFAGSTYSLNGNVAPESVWEIFTSQSAEIAFKATGSAQEVRLPLTVQSKVDWGPRVCLP